MMQVNRVQWLKRVLLAVVALAFVGTACSREGVSTSELATVASEAEDAVNNNGEDAPPAEGSDDEATANTSEETEVAEPEALDMPDLVGRTESEARAKLADLGVDNITATEKESFDSPGLVVEQIPSPGRALDPSDSVSLVVSTDFPPMPDFVGTSLTEARNWAEVHGIETRVSEVVKLDLADEEVVEQVPAAGAPVSTELILTVARTPAFVDLSSLTPVDRACWETEDIEIDGSLFPGALRSTTCSSFSAEYNLSRDFTLLQFSIGLSDNGPSDSIYQVEIHADGEVVYNETIVFGERRDVELDVVDVLRLQISGAPVTTRTNVGFVNARLIGSLAGDS